ncbi:MAG: cbb3-type cytochrome c oxidase subunit I [Chloroflexota bacterium]
MYKLEHKLTAWHMGIALAALAIGGLIGPFQKLEHVGVNLYSLLRPIGVQSYYQGLTIHGVLNALVWTTFFITGFFTFATVHSLGRPMRYPRLSIAALVVMGLGTVMAAVPVLLNQATVLFTFYPPLKASPFYYIGLTLVVVGSWMVGWSMYFTYGAWRKEHPGERTPFIALASLITMVMWQIATFGIAVEMLWLVIPWSLGLVEGTDPQLARTLFWFTGHPIVYFWLLPAYVSWYGMVPKQAGGKMFSEPLARLAFWLFLILSTPVGFHHQYMDPGVPVGWKYFHAIFTYGVFFPSMLTAFTVIASLELGGRARGGTGLLGWIRKLPWGDPSYAAQNLAMILFAFGGISGLTNASYNMNLVVHNTIWVPGHFHLTVGTAVTLSFFGILYWLLPKLTGKELWNRKAAVWQAWTWFIGMIFMSNAMHVMGLRFGIPRRTMLGVAPYADAEWQLFLIEAAVGALILLVSGILFYLNVVGTVFFSRKLTQPVEMPVAEPLDPHPSPAWLDAWRPWLAVALVLIIVAYGPMLITMISQVRLNAPGFRVW